MSNVITGAHTIIYTPDPEALRAWFRDVLGFPFVDAGHGWLIFRLPPGEIAAHPADGGLESARHELFLMCDDLDATVAELRAKGVEFAGEVSEQRWGRLITIRMPGGGDLGLYQPSHPVAANL